jgi:quercetin dioxygenase-like cupin family protein
MRRPTLIQADAALRRRLIQAFDKKTMIEAFKVQSLFEVRLVDRAGGCERPHTHEALIISAVAGGQIRLQVGEEEICLRPGTVGAIGPHVLHCVRSFSTDFSGRADTQLSDLR